MCMCKCFKDLCALFTGKKILGPPSWILVEAERGRGRKEETPP